nr:UbiA family prenyltransferase [Haloferax sp. ATB1]
MNRTNAAPPTGGLRRSLASLARLVRVPNLFTAPPDVILGAVLVSGGRPSVPLSSLAGVALASVLLYAAGTTLNDYADADEDAQHRPERPIPSGDVSRTRARNLGVALLGAGVVVAAVAGGPTTGVVAAVLGLLVALYDGALKDTPLGFAAMGGCRGANVALGMAVVTGSPSTPTPPTWVSLVPVVVALYIAGVTYMAESETGAGDSGAVLVGMAGVGLAVGSVVVAAVAVGIGPSRLRDARRGRRTPRLVRGVDRPRPPDRLRRPPTGHHRPRGRYVRPRTRRAERGGRRTAESRVGRRRGGVRRPRGRPVDGVRRVVN